MRGKFIEIISGVTLGDFEPFLFAALGVALALDVLFVFEKSVKVVVAKSFSGIIGVFGEGLPQQAIIDVGGLGLLADAIFDLLFFGVADFDPSVVILNAWGVVGIDHRLDEFKGTDFGRGHVGVSIPGIGGESWRAVGGGLLCCRLESMRGGK